MNILDTIVWKSKAEFQLALNSDEAEEKEWIKRKWKLNGKKKLAGSTFRTLRCKTLSTLPTASTPSRKALSLTYGLAVLCYLLISKAILDCDTKKAYFFATVPEKALNGDATNPTKEDYSFLDKI